MVWRNGQDKGIPLHDVIVKLRVLRRIRGRMHQGEVQLPGQKKLFQYSRVFFTDIQLDIGAEFVKAGKDLREHQSPQMVGSTKVDASGL